MTEQEQLAINVWLAGRSYRIRISPTEEEAVRRAVKIADDKIMDLRQHYSGKDDQDFIAMCLLMYAADHVSHPLHHPVVQHEIEQLIHKVDGTLNKEEEGNA